LGRRIDCSESPPPASLGQSYFVAETSWQSNYDHCRAGPTAQIGASDAHIVSLKFWKSVSSLMHSSVRWRDTTAEGEQNSKSTDRAFQGTLSIGTGTIDHCR
jgi:hypothetical protein